MVCARPMRSGTIASGSTRYPRFHLFDRGPALDSCTSSRLDGRTTAPTAGAISPAKKIAACLILGKDAAVNRAQTIERTMQTAFAAEKEEHPPYKRASCPYLPLHVYYTTPAALALCCRSGLLESTTFLIPQFRGGIGIQGLAERATRKRQVTVATPVWLTLALPA